MISGNSVDFLDSQESLLKQKIKEELDVELFSSQESFSDFWTNVVGPVPENIIPVFNDSTKDFVEDNSGVFGGEEIFPEADTKEFIKDNPDIFKDIVGEQSDDNANIPTTSNDAGQSSSNHMTINHSEMNCLEIHAQDYIGTPKSSNMVKSNGSDKLFPGSISGDPGQFDFSVQFMDHDEVITKSIHFTHSFMLNKLYVQCNEPCPIQFKCGINPPDGCIIQVRAIFKRPQDRSEVVESCKLHKETSTGDPKSTGRLIQVDMFPLKKVRYDVLPEGHETVSFPYENPDIGWEYQITRFKFTCLSSCKSGINRRPTSLVFYLMSPEGDVLGCRVMDICICTRPGRDRERDENKIARKDEKKREDKKVLKRSNTEMLLPEPPLKATNDNRLFTLIIRGQEKYEKLLQYKQALDLSEMVSEDQRKEYLKMEKENQVKH